MLLSSVTAPGALNCPNAPPEAFEETMLPLFIQTIDRLAEVATVNELAGV
jgi:hypothetical protein